MLSLKVYFQCTKAIICVVIYTGSTVGDNCESSLQPSKIVAGLPVKLAMSYTNNSALPPAAVARRTEEGAGTTADWRETNHKQIVIQSGVHREDDTVYGKSLTVWAHQ